MNNTLLPVWQEQLMRGHFIIRERGYLAGWGRLEPPIIDINGNGINPPNSKPDQVQEVRIPVKQCPIDHDHPTLLCGQYLQGRKSPCKVK